ncbi:MAG TPA: pitrilysin family protein [Candidatus Limnocylindria bacterium]|nr:pitrilysin family protein [Candidatus Limnocylindria bacterium]
MNDESRAGHIGHPGFSRDETDPEQGFVTDQDPLADVVDEGADVLTQQPPASAAVATGEPDLSVLDVRPTAGPPREYHFPAFERGRLANGLTLLAVNLPGRALLAAQLILPGGATAERAAQAGVTALTARALTEGTARLDAVEFAEAAERLGAELHAEASWEALSCSLEVPRSRFAAALALLAEMTLEPRFPEDEVARLREERLNDLLQARADPRRRAERVFPETIYDPASPYSRPLGGTDTTVREIERAAVVERHLANLDPASATLVVAGDLIGLDVPRLVEEHFAAWQHRPAAARDESAGAHPAGPRVVLVDRPGSSQSELRIGHVGLPRSTPEFHAVAVLNAILGGAFNSRLNRLLREELGYTYGVHSSFDMRRGAGPFVVRTGVETDVTVAAITEAMGVLRAIRQAPVEPAELEIVRDYLVGIFPLRFEVSAAVAGALAGLAIFELPDDELDEYRPRIAAVQASDVLAAARRHVRPDEASIVIVGDATRIEGPLRDAQLGPLTVVPADAAPG